LLASVVASCSSETPITYDSEPMLVLSSKLLCGNSEHEVLLTISSQSVLTMPSMDAVVRCYVNDVLVDETSDWEDYGKYHVIRKYIIHADFKEGDKVRIEAEDGEFSVYAENTFPKACELSVDSSSVEGTRWDGYAPSREYSFKLRVKDVVGEDSYYAAVLPEYWVSGKPYASMYGQGDSAPISKLEFKLSYNMEDPVFNESDSPVPDMVGVYTGIELGVENSMRIFSDKLFKDDEHCFNLDSMDQCDFRPYDFAYDDLETKVIFRVVSLSKEDYDYYCYLNLYNNAGLLSDLPTTHSNVVGGTGQVLALSPTELTLPLKTIRYGD